MAEPGPPKKVLPFVGLLITPEVDASAVVERVSSGLFAVKEPAGPFPFDYTGYYVPEMGENIARYWAVAEALCEPDELAAYKLKANELEREFAVGGRRRVNIDPGHIAEFAVTVATCKTLPAAVYVGGGVYGHLLFIYRSGSFVPLDWTYPEFAEHVAFFNAGRKALLNLAKTG
jgi:hypothetical protein